MSDFLEIDFCKGKSLRFARRFNVKAGIESEKLAGATSMGCNYAVSHRASDAPGSILSRVNKQTGADVSDLLTSGNESSDRHPGPTPHLDAVPGVFLSGGSPPSFPVTAPQLVPRLFANGRECFISQQIGLGGGGTGFRPTILLPPGNLEYIDPSTLALHANRWYFGCVSSTEEREAFRLTYATQITHTGTRPVYVWQGFPGQGTNRTCFGTGNLEHHIGVSVVGICPALRGHDSRVATPPVEPHEGGLPSSVNVNGPDQTRRKFSYPIVGEGTNPNFSETSFQDFVLENTRPTCTVFSQSEFDDEFGYAIRLIDGQVPNFAEIELPLDQYGSVAGLAFNFLAAGATSFFNSGLFTNPLGSSQGRLYGPVNQAAQFDINPEAESLSFEIRTADQVPGQPTQTFSIDLPKVAGDIGWFEIVYTVYSRIVGGGA